jgi:hypothetical protein
MDTALVTGEEQLAEVTGRPNAQIYSFTNANVVIATDTLLTFDVEMYDNDGMADLAVDNDQLTVQTAGVYWVNCLTAIIGGFATLTSSTAILRRNGVDIYRYKSRKIASAGGLEVTFAMPMECAVGDSLQLAVRWTGTGGPATFQTRRLAASLLVAL